MSRFGSPSLLLGAVSLSVLLLALLASLSRTASAAADDKFYLYDETDYDDESPQTHPQSQHQDESNAQMSMAHWQRQQEELKRQQQLQEQHRQQEQQRQQQLQEYQLRFQERREVEEQQRQIEEQQRRQQQQQQQHNQEQKQSQEQQSQEEQLEEQHHLQRQQQQQKGQEEQRLQQQRLQQQQRQEQLEEQHRLQQEQQRLQQQQQQQRQIEERHRQIEEQQRRRQQQQHSQEQQQSQEQEQQSQEELEEHHLQQQQQQQEEQMLQQQRLQQQQRQEQLEEQHRLQQQRQEQQRLQQQQQQPQPAEQQPRAGPTYRPVPQRPVPPPHDPNVIFVPRLGSVRGRVPDRTLADSKRAINAFLGVRYGSVRPGLGRFQRADAPRYDLARDTDVVDATREPAACPQFPDLERLQEEVRRGVNVDDCLTLNIYAPNKPGNYPVIVFVHGEMLFDGSAEEGQPDYFLEHDVVLVSLNYRLAPFGFLTSLTDELPGNVALADIQLALEWVQQYIRPFGGDPAQVTLLGQAGGATLVHALSLSGKAEGLFHKLILQSGTALNPYLLDESPLESFRALARAARCPAVTGLNLPNAIACFERLSTPELLAIFKRHWEENEGHGLRFTGGFKLAIGDRLGYLPQHPAAMIARSTYPLLAGTTKDAGAFILSRFYKQLEQVRTRNISDYIDVVLKHTAQPRHHGIWKQWALREIFTPEDIRRPVLQSLAQGLLELVNLILYRAPLIDAIRHTSPKYATFLYVFDYRGEFHRFGFLPNPLPFQADATLSDDNIYLFPYPAEVSQLNDADRKLARTLTTLWLNFAQYGTPAPTPSSAVWPNVTSEYGPFVRITKSEESPLELDYHFGEGIPVPNLYPEWFTTTTTTTTTTPRYPNYPTPPNNSNYPSAQQHYSSYQARHVPPPAWRAHETVLEDPNESRMPPPPPPPPQQPRYPGYPVYSSRAKNIPNKRYRSAQG